MQQFLRILQGQPSQPSTSTTSNNNNNTTTTASTTTPPQSPSRGSRRPDSQKRTPKKAASTTATTTTTASSPRSTYARSISSSTLPNEPSADSSSMAAIVPQTPTTTNPPGIKPPPGKDTFYAITGIATKQDGAQGPYKKAGVRQNIDDWSADPDNEAQVHLFVMALDRFMKVDPHDRDSFFQIAGIHGQPNIAWDEDLPDSGFSNKGYCTHNNVLFPIWHRPYLVLYEQRLHEIMVNEIIPGFPKDTQNHWREAADSWRLPFWDWGRTNRVPRLAKYPTTIVPKANGDGVERIDNPLYQFKMPNLLPMSSEKVAEFKDPWLPEDKADTLYFGDCIATSRWPDLDDIKKGSEAWKHGVVNNFKVEDAMKGGERADPKFPPQAEPMYRLLTVPLDYDSFATTAQLDEKNQAVQNDLNIEGLHNLIHGLVGGDYNGHMSQIPVATFDPLFWLHHCNIDRIFAMWQALNPQKYITESQVNSFFQDIIDLPKGTKITNKTPLRPFHKTKEGAYFDSDDARYTYDLGYTYPELQTWDPKYNQGGNFNQEVFTKDLTTFINETYGHSRELLLSASTSLGGTEPVDGGKKSIDWAFSVRYRKFAFGGEPFWVRLYLSMEKGKQNATNDLIASIYNFSQAPETNGKVNCAECVQALRDNAKATQYISITPILLNLIKQGQNLTSLSKEDVLKFLRERAYWRVFRNGQEQPSYEVQKVELEIIGSSNDNTQYNDATKLPKVENFKTEPELVGGGDGALDDKLKQPVVQPPPPTAAIPAGNLKVGGELPFKEPLSRDNVVIVETSKVDRTPSTADGIDNSQFYFLTEAGGDDITFLMSIRRKEGGEGQIVFNHKLNGFWGLERRINFRDFFKKDNAPAVISVHDQGDGYEVMIDWVHAMWYKKDDPSKIAKVVAYSVNKPHKPVWSRSLNVKVFPSMAQLFGLKIGGSS